MPTYKKLVVNGNGVRSVNHAKVSHWNGGLIVPSSASFPYSISVSITNGSYSLPSATIESGGSVNINIYPETNYTYPSSFTVTGASYSFNSTTGVLTISNPTANVTISGACVSTLTTYTVSVSITGGSADGPSTIVDGATNTYTIEANSGYNLPTISDITVTNATIKSYSSSTGVLKINAPTGNVTISATCAQVVSYTITLSPDSHISDIYYAIRTTPGPVKTWTHKTSQTALTVEDGRYIYYYTQASSGYVSNDPQESNRYYIVNGANHTISLTSSAAVSNPVVTFNYAQYSQYSAAPRLGDLYYRIGSSGSYTKATKGLASLTLTAGQTLYVYTSHIDYNVQTYTESEPWVRTVYGDTTIYLTARAVEGTITFAKQGNGVGTIYVYDPNTMDDFEPYSSPITTKFGAPLYYYSTNVSGYTQTYTPSSYGVYNYSGTTDGSETVYLTAESNFKTASNASMNVVIDGTLGSDADNKFYVTFTNPNTFGVMADIDIYVTLTTEHHFAKTDVVVGAGATKSNLLIDTMYEIDDGCGGKDYRAIITFKYNNTTVQKEITGTISYGTIAAPVIGYDDQQLIYSNKLIYTVDNDSTIPVYADITVRKNVSVTGTGGTIIETITNRAIPAGSYYSNTHTGITSNAAVDVIFKLQGSVSQSATEICLH